ncbi:response regulator [Occallatibacter savannae]|uniref:response regulator n=1 Tax=Occallatibacter savannae TaxID=1002691 RepID=UPI000D68D835|nr:response regulator [Occallatibacter savannae]
MAQQGFKLRILFVDDDAGLRETSALILKTFGHEVRTAEDGFQALVELRSVLPDLIVSDLRMPGMSGFELLSIVRQRFPHIPVIAISGEFFGTGITAPLADAFLLKGQYKPPDLASKIEELIGLSPLRPHLPKPHKAPVWIPINGKDYVVLTCPDCLRSFSEPRSESQGILEANCPACMTKVRYILDAISDSHH